MVFDPTEAVTFDLQYGHVHLDGAPTRVMVPSDALVSLCRAAPAEAATALGHAMGTAMGKRAAVRIAEARRAEGADGAERAAAVRASTLESVIGELAVEAALVGVGALSAERWGKVLVLVHDQSPLGEAGDALLGDILEAALSALTNKAVRVVPLERVGVRARFAVVSSRTATEMQTRLGNGEGWGTIIAALHRAEPPPA